MCIRQFKNDLVFLTLLSLIFVAILKGICQDFENFCKCAMDSELDSCKFNMWKKFWNWLHCFWVFVLWFCRPNISLKTIPKKKNKSLAIVWRQSDSVTHWSSMSDVFIFFSIEGNRTQISLWHHALFWMGVFGRRSLTRNLSVFRMPLKNLD